jgi:hypothetical protein
MQRTGGIGLINWGRWEMSKRTPGPWIANIENSGSGYPRIESEHEHGVVNDGWIICDCEGPDGKANARLIAAAPELLEACKKLIYQPDLQVAIDAARVAIAKAEGDGL